MSTTGALPIAWLPPEALVDMKFSEASDVWAFGVTMVECFTRGAPPYNEWTPLDIMYRVKEGYVILKPKACPASWYSTLIRPCFTFAADGRPLFKQLVTALENIDPTAIQDDGASGGAAKVGNDAAAAADAAEGPSNYLTTNEMPSPDANGHLQELYATLGEGDALHQDTVEPMLEVTEVQLDRSATGTLRVLENSEVVEFVEVEVDEAVDNTGATGRDTGNGDGALYVAPLQDRALMAPWANMLYVVPPADGEKAAGIEPMLSKAGTQELTVLRSSRKAIEIEGLSSETQSLEMLIGETRSNFYTSTSPLRTEGGGEILAFNVELKKPEEDASELLNPVLAVPADAKIAECISVSGMNAPAATATLETVMNTLGTEPETVPSPAALAAPTSASEPAPAPVPEPAPEQETTAPLADLLAASADTAASHGDNGPAEVETEAETDTSSACSDDGAQHEQHFDVFISHDWGEDEQGRDNHARAGLLNDLLKAEGISTWFDAEMLPGGPINDSMCDGIESSSAVLCLLTRQYIEKVASKNPQDNCRKEFMHASRIQSADHMIAIVMEPGLRNTMEWYGPVGLELGGHHHVDLAHMDTTTTQCDPAMQLLLTQVLAHVSGQAPRRASRASRMLNASPTRSPSPVRVQPAPVEFARPPTAPELGRHRQLSPLNPFGGPVQLPTIGSRHPPMKVDGMDSSALAEMQVKLDNSDKARTAAEAHAKEELLQTQQDVESIKSQMATLQEAIAQDEEEAKSRASYMETYITLTAEDSTKRDAEATLRDEADAARKLELRKIQAALDEANQARAVAEKRAAEERSWVIQESMASAQASRNASEVSLQILARMDEMRAETNAMKKQMTEQEEELQDLKEELEDTDSEESSDGEEEDDDDDDDDDDEEDGSEDDDQDHDDEDDDDVGAIDQVEPVAAVAASSGAIVEVDPAATEPPSPAPTAQAGAER